jgi:hypothetical protein
VGANRGRLLLLESAGTSFGIGWHFLRLHFLRFGNPRPQGGIYSAWGVNPPSYTHLVQILHCPDGDNEVPSTLEADPDGLGAWGAVGFPSQVASEASQENQDLS